MPASRDRQNFPGAYAELDSLDERAARASTSLGADGKEGRPAAAAPDDEEFVYALADALHEEYKGIVEAGLLLQVDDAVLMHEADTMLSRGQSWEDYRRWAQLRVDALNHALRGLPEEQIRYHICFGSWHGPHAYDPPLRDSIDLVLRCGPGIT